MVMYAQKNITIIQFTSIYQSYIHKYLSIYIPIQCTLYINIPIISGIKILGLLLVDKAIRKQPPPGHHRVPVSMFLPGVAQGAGGIPRSQQAKGGAGQKGRGGKDARSCRRERDGWDLAMSLYRYNIWIIYYVSYIIYLYDWYINDISGWW